MTAERGDDNFQSKLNEASKAKAREELNERNNEDRKLAVQTLRHWVIQQDHWLKSPTDFEFLLRFLRIRKFSQLGARQTLENYWTNKLKRPELHTDLDPTDPIIQDILRAKTYYSPKQCDKDGCRWIYSPFGYQTAENIKKWGRTNVYRAMVLFLEWLCFDENVQVNGIKWFMDLTGVTIAALISKYSKPDDQKHMGQIFQRSTPLRLKGLYVYNPPGFFDLLYSTFSVLARPKILERVHMLGFNMTKVYEQVDAIALPDEYFPDDYDGPSAGPEAQIVEDMLTDMTSPKFMKYITEVTSSKYGIDPKKKPTSDTKAMPSFRKIEL